MNIKKVSFSGSGDEQKKGPHPDFLRNCHLAKDWAHAPHQGPSELVITLSKFTLNFSYKSPKNGNYSNPIELHQPHNTFVERTKETFKIMCDIVYKDKERIRKESQE